MTNKEAAIQQYTQARLNEIEFKQSLVGMLAQNPDLIKDAGMREAGLDAARTIYKIRQFRRGVSPSSIINNQLKDDAPRNRVQSFVEIVHNMTAGTIMEEGVSYEVGQHGER